MDELTRFVSKLRAKNHVKCRRGCGDVVSCCWVEAVYRGGMPRRPERDYVSADGVGLRLFDWRYDRRLHAYRLRFIIRWM